MSGHEFLSLNRGRLMRMIVFVMTTAILVSACGDGTLRPLRNNEKGKVFSQWTIRQCNEIDSTKCGGCVDGTTIEHYYVETAPGKEKSKWENRVRTTGKHFIGEGHVSHCHECVADFKLRREGEADMSPVSCEEFYKYIEDFNAKCGRCVKVIRNYL